MSSPEELLQKYFGFDHFREGQAEAIQRVLNGQHTLLVMPTGSGKSLTYQLPALLQPGLTLVISPLISLMQDQVDHMTEIGLPATYINSSLPTHEVNRRTRAVLEGQVKLLYIAPERLRNRAFTGALARIKVSLLAVDEAHCISQWGHDFRPDYLQIGPTWQAMGRPTLLATTATATPTVQKDIIKMLDLPEDVQAIVTGFNRPNLTLRVIQAPDTRAKYQILQALLRKVEGSAIVYAATRRNTDEVADFIQNVMLLPAQAYHAGLDRDTRHRVQSDFMSDRFKIVVATNAFGMGVDKADVRTVIHYNMPATIEAYYQEAGRAGRDGLPAECVLLFAPEDYRLQNWLINSDTPSYDDLHQLYTRFAQAANNDEVYFKLDELAQWTGLHQVKIRVALSELEQAGVIYHLGDHNNYGQWKVLPLSLNKLNEQARAISRRAQIRLGLLAKMLDYTRLSSCRRQFLLNYFGDISAPRSPRCCDNHSTDNIEDLPKAVTPQEWLPLIVLETVRSLQQRPVGRARLAQLLNGSQAKTMDQSTYQGHKFYGKLNMLSQVQITGLIDALISARFLQITGDELPVLGLSPLGLKALEVRAALPLNIPVLPAPGGAAKEEEIARWQKSSQRSDTVMETFDLFQQGLSLAEIAAERNLTENTIYHHLARLIADGKVELHQIISSEIEAKVLEAVQTIGAVAPLSPVKAILPESISFEQIRCVLAAHPELPRERQSLSGAETPAQRVVTLGEQGNPEDVPELIAALTHEDGNVRRLAASALGKLGDQRAVEPLIALLKTDQGSQVRQYAIKALGKLGDLRARPILEQITANPDEADYNIKAAETALAMLGRQEEVSAAQSADIVTPSALPASSTSLDQVVLQAVAKLGGTLGRTGLAQVLRGSGPDWLEAFRDHSAYGQLSHLSRKAIMNIIDALIADGKLMVTGGFRPKVILPEQNLHTAPRQEDNAALQADEPRHDPIVQTRPAQSISPPQATPPPALVPDPQLFERLRTWRSRQAKAQNLPPYIIFPNKVLEEIAAHQPTTLAEMALISGIGQIKLEQHGQAIISLISDYLNGPTPAQPSQPLETQNQAPEIRNSGAALEEVKEPKIEHPSQRPPVEKSEPKAADGKMGTKGPLRENPEAAILAVIADLSGLLTVQSLVQLLTAGPEEIVSFSDHELFAAFHGQLSADDILSQIQKLLQNKQLVLNRRQYLDLP